MNEWPDFQIPTEWTLTRMDELATKLKAGGTPSRQHKGNFGGDIPFVLIEDMTSSGVYLKSTKETITREGLESCSAWIVPENTVLLSMYATIGATAITTFPVATNQAILAIIPREDCDREYLSFCLQAHKRHLARLNVESTQKNINKGIVSSFPLPLPPLPEQKKIAHILSTVQRAIEAQERIIQTTTELKKALMHKLFTEGLRNEPQKQTEIGPVPESWEVVDLGDVINLFAGYAFKSDEGISESNTQLLRMGNLYQNTLDLNRSPIFYPDSFAAAHKRFVLKEGDLVMSLTGTSGKEDYGFTVRIPRTDKTLLLNQRVTRIDVTDHRLQKDFAHHFLLSRKFLDHLYPTAKGMKQANLSTNAMKKLKVVLPGEAEQAEIATCFKSLDQKVVVAGRKVAALQDLFRTLLHELMTAKTRVHEIEFSTQHQGAA